MKVSVIIPIYNVEPYLKKCIESVLRQDFSDYEVLLVDDGSTDSSPAICDEYAQTYPQVQVIHQENKGLGGARNTGIQAARGDYLLFLDSDDSLTPDALYSLYGTATENQADLVAFGMDFVDEQDQVLTTRRPTQSDFSVVKKEDRFAVFFKDSYVCNKFFRRSLFTDFGIVFPERIWYEDLCVIPKIILYVQKAVLMQQSFYRYLQRSDSIMHVKNTDKNRAMITVIGSVLDFYREREQFETYRNELCFLTVMHMMVLCTLRVAVEDRKHPLLSEFYEFTDRQFPDFRKNEYVKRHLSRRHSMIFALSRRKQYLGLAMLNKFNSLRNR